jgi:hypothetical protein
VVLTGWQTVAISLGGGAITGTTAFVATWLRGKQDGTQLDRRLVHEREHQARELEAARAEQWRDRLVRAADDFSTGAMQAMLALRDALVAARHGDLKRQVEEVDGAWSHEYVSELPTVIAAVRELERRVDEAHARLARVHLLFGETSEAGRAADAVIEALRRSVEHVGRYFPGPDEVRGEMALSDADEATAAFGRAALEQIRDPERAASAAIDAPRTRLALGEWRISNDSSED